MPELGVLIPARNEIWLRHTIEDVLKNSSPGTEVVAVLDGYWPEEGQGIPQHERVTIIHRPESIGQRAATNEAARVSTARYLMKLDAHCAVAPGFDKVLIASAQELGEDVTQVPGQYNLHGWDWVCGCGSREYQSPSKPCPQCKSNERRREAVWKPKKSPFTTAWRFDRELHFKYWNEFRKRPEGQGEITETISCLGACWFMSRDRYWDLGGLDEGHGSWGQMGTEIGCKSWLSGGRLVCNKRTWFAHMFRTQGQDFGFPYSLTVGAQRRARKYSQDLWLNNRWSRATRPFSWIMDHFKPVKDWEDWKGGDASDGSPLLGTTDIPSATEPCPVASEEAGQGSIAPAVVTPKVSRGIIYYSDCRPSPDLLRVCHEQLLRAGADLPLVGVTLGKPPFALNGCGEYIFKAWSRGILTMFRQILEGLEALDTDIAFLCEHDLLYHPSHFSFTPEKRDVFYYNENTFKVDFHSGQALFYYTKQTSGLCADRKLLVEHYHRRIAKVVQNQRDLETQGLPVRRDGFSRHMGFEPGCHRPPRGVDHYPALRWMSEQPNIDIRHDHNLTPSRWSQDKFRSKNSCQGWKMTDEVPGWGRTKGRFSEFLKEVADGRRSFSK